MVFNYIFFMTLDQLFVRLLLAFRYLQKASVYRYIILLRFYYIVTETTIYIHVTHLTSYSFRINP